MDYWYEKIEIPQIAKDRIKQMVCGKIIGEICPKDHESVTLYQVSDETFHDLFTMNRSYLYQGDFTAPPDENEYQNGFNIVTESGLAGLYVTTDGWLISVFSNEKWRGFVRMTSDLVRDKVKKVVCIVAGDELLSALTQLYMDIFDLKVVAATIDDRKIMTEYYGAGFIEQFCEKRGIPHHVFLGRKNMDVNEVKRFSDYFQALDYVDHIPFRQ